MSIEDIVEIHGERPYEGAIEISVLVVAVSESPLTSDEWSRLDACCFLEHEVRAG